MGQGVYTAIAMILAEELDADFPHVTLEHAPPNDKLYGNPVFGLQVTGNSNSIRAWWTQLRKGGVGARAMLVQAAAQQWEVDPASCTAANGEVIHKESGRRLSYGALAQAAGQPNVATRRRAQGPERFRVDRKAAEAPRHAQQGQRQDGLRDRRDPPWHEVRNRRGVSGVRRQGW
jgi:CO/xanthine dehydrogenase Mo-binding subunit